VFYGAVVVILLLLVLMSIVSHSLYGVTEIVVEPEIELEASVELVLVQDQPIEKLEIVIPASKLVKVTLPSFSISNSQDPGIVY